MKNFKHFILALLFMAVCLPSMTAQPAGYDKYFRKIGEHHNAVIKYLLDVMDSNPTHAEIRELSGERMAKIYPGSNFNEAYKKNRAYQTFVKSFQAADDQVSFLSDYMSPKGYEYLTQIANITVQNSYSQIISDLEGVIENLIADRTLETSEKNALLYGCATGISSTYLWSGETGQLVWRNSKAAPPTANLSAISAEDGIIKTDACGAIGGAVGGAAVGLVVASAPSAVVCGGVMGIGTSTAKGVSKLWSWLVD